MNFGVDIGDYAVVGGHVAAVDDGEFRIPAGLGDFTVEVDELAENPLDDEGFMKIRTGDAVRGIGRRRKRPSASWALESAQRQPRPRALRR